MATITINPEGFSARVVRPGHAVAAQPDMVLLASRYLSRITTSTPEARAVEGWFLETNQIFQHITAAYLLLGNGLAEKSYNAVNPGTHRDSHRATIQAHDNPKGIWFPAGNASSFLDTNIPVYDMVEPYRQGVMFYIKENLAGVGESIVLGMQADGQPTIAPFIYCPTTSGSGVDTIGIYSNTQNVASIYQPGLVALWLENEGGTICYRVAGKTYRFPVENTFYQDYLFLYQWPTLAFASRANADYILRTAIHFSGLREEEVMRLEEATINFLKASAKW